MFTCVCVCMCVSAVLVAAFLGGRTSAAMCLCVCDGVHSRRFLPAGGICFQSGACRLPLCGGMLPCLPIHRFHCVFPWVPISKICVFPCQLFLLFGCPSLPPFFLSSLGCDRSQLTPLLVWQPENSLEKGQLASFSRGPAQSQRPFSVVRCGSALFWACLPHIQASQLAFPSWSHSGRNGMWDGQGRLAVSCMNALH